MCPYCDKQELEDEEHLLWRCIAWKVKREPLMTEIMLLAKAPKLGSLREWPPCIRLCGIIPDSVVRASSIGEGERWRKRCMDLGKVPRQWLQRPVKDVEDRLRQVDRLAEAGATWAAQDTHPWQLFAMKLHEMFLSVLRERKGADNEAGSLFPTSRKGYQRSPPVLGAVPREWRWGPDLLPMVIRWTTELQWLKMPPPERRRPQVHWQVSYMELALDFEAYAGRQLPPAPQSGFVGGEMPLQEKARVLKLITSLMGRSIGQDTILPAKMTNHCKTLIPMGAGLVMGLEGCPLFTRPL